MAFKIFRNNCCGLDVHKTWIYACIGIRWERDGIPFGGNGLSTTGSEISDGFTELSEEEARQIDLPF